MKMQTRCPFWSHCTRSEVGSSWWGTCSWI